MAKTLAEYQLAGGNPVYVEVEGRISALWRVTLG